MDALRLSLLIFGALLIFGIYLWTSHKQHQKRQQRVGWEAPDSATVPNVELDKNDVSPDSQDYHFIPDDDHTPDVEKVYTQDIAPESMSFNDTGEFRNLSTVINETVQERNVSDVPSVFVKPKVYTSKLDETKSHIKAVQEQQRQQEKQQREPAGKAGKVIVINLMARPGLAFKGSDVLHALQQAGLVFGDMNIFHFTEEADGRKTVLFSLANMVNPGTFDMQHMQELTTPGLSLFLQLPGSGNGVKVFEKMLTTAQNLRKELDGELCDESRSALTYQTISHLKEDIRDYCFKHQQA